MKHLFATLTFCLLVVSTTFAQTIVGTWKTIDDDSKKAKSYVEIYEKDGKFYGKVVDLLLKPDDTVCSKCSGSKKGQKVVGMNIITKMKKKGKEWSGGNILDPEKGKEYTCKMWFDAAGNLKVRGYWGIVYRTQTWYRK